MAGIAQHRRPQNTLDIWPGFVDALATLLMVIIFLLSIFMLAQFFLTEQLANRDSAMKRLETQVAELADMLALERQAGAELRESVAALSTQLQSSTAARDRLSAEVDRLTGDLGAARSELEAARERTGDLAAQLEAQRRRLGESRERLAEREKRLNDMSGQLEQSRSDLADEEALSEARRNEIARLSRNLEVLRQEMARLNAALEASEAKSQEQKARIANLGKRLNAALASRVEELSRYRSEFFGKLREVLGNREDIRIVGDRFVFQSEVLFGSADAELGVAGRAQIERLSATLLELSKRIPTELDWVVRVDGHTDQRPISTSRFPSNWELSTARAVSVVKAMIDEGVPPDRLAATGFGEHQPIDSRNLPESWEKNRRIEFKLTER